MTKQFIGTCVDNPFRSTEKLSSVIDSSVPMSKRAFMMACDVSEGIRAAMRRFPNDYGFYKNGGVCFFTWSAIEHFYK